ncbi:hypothetical protein RintRC_2573 [Richelia intracellularis]|nr:hypothetical protein RintRC_2573 [Richelia intracellularis]
MIVINSSLSQISDTDPKNYAQVYFPYLRSNTDGFDHIILLG